jgi:acid stress chaperone HdeB
VTLSDYAATCVNNAEAINPRCCIGQAMMKANSSPGENVMLKSIIVSGLIFFCAAVSTARAQVTLDVSKITCDQFTGYKITNPQNIAIWLSGYYSGKRDTTIVETQTLVANAKELRDYCIRNPQTPVMRAVETLFDKDKK